ncbi:MAG: hypothetical protein HQL87_08590 [Magnetococcales bacterium]|nr:hypothetical protein [Magnetococcales bacterium]
MPDGLFGPFQGIHVKPSIKREKSKRIRLIGALHGRIDVRRYPFWDPSMTRNTMQIFPWLSPLPIINVMESDLTEFRGAHEVFSVGGKEFQMRLPRLLGTTLVTCAGGPDMLVP